MRSATDMILLTPVTGQPFVRNVVGQLFGQLYERDMYVFPVDRVMGNKVIPIHEEGNWVD